jgi:hypothetical protein
MTRPFRDLALVVAVVLGGIGLSPFDVEAAGWQAPTSRQVVVFGVLATPGSKTMDKDITPAVAAELRRRLPNHGFKLLKAESQKTTAGQTVTCKLGEGYVATTRLLTPLDINGRVQMRFELLLDDVPQFQTIVATPPDQLNYADKMLPDNSHILIGIGAR